MLYRIICIYLFSSLVLKLHAQEIDVRQYRFHLELNDDNDRIRGIAEISVHLLQPSRQFALDLVQEDAAGKGMKVDSVVGFGIADFSQENNQISISLRPSAPPDLQVRVVYSGVPADGLIISKNKYGDRTFFADNWPRRAHDWIPCHDDPEDKAPVEFEVVAPARYSVVSNGSLVEEVNLDKNWKRTHWREVIPLPTKVMVIGAAQFAVSRVDTGYSIPVTAWVYPQNQKEGFYDYALATGILQFFSRYIGPFPFEKLANVQSKTIFGGMENASAIFYDENSVTGNRKCEDLLAHEIAHQWFGDMATEKAFSHLWLSEGFASYLTDVYWEHAYGRDAFQSRLRKERDAAVQFCRFSQKPVVDSSSQLMDLLNANNYQKGAWVLHMLRVETGDSVFQRILQEYYAKFKGGNADTRDFQKVAEAVSGKDLSGFFNQWLYRPGIPKISVGWRWAKGKLKLKVEQSGNPVFAFPLEIGLVDKSGKRSVQKLQISEAMTSFELPLPQKPVQIELDPETKLLFDGTVSSL